MKKETYDVGYGKPPKHSQFKKGQSGNPNGKPKVKKPVAMQDLVAKCLAEPHAIKKGNKVVKLSAQEIALMALIKKASEGQIPAIKLLMEAAKSLPPNLIAQKPWEFRENSASMELVEKIIKDVEKYVTVDSATGASPPQDEDDEGS